MEQTNSTNGYEWLIHMITVDFVATLASLSMIYSVSCVLFRLSIFERITADEYTQFFSSLFFALSVLLSEKFQGPNVVKTPEESTLDYAKAVFVLCIMRWTFLTQIRGPLCSFKKHEIEDMNGKIVLITGATSGIGLEAVKKLYKECDGIHIILPCRDTSKGEILKSEIIKNSNTKNNSEIHVETLDLESFESVKKFAHRIQEKYSRVDVLVNNAGAMLPTRHVTRDGNEAMMQTNLYSPFLLTILMIPLLAKSDMRRVVQVGSSTANKHHRIQFEDMNFEKNFFILTTYSHSKYYLNQVTLELAKRLKDLQISVNGCHPGAVQTGVSRHLHWFLRMGHKMIRCIVKCSAEGCNTILHLIVNQNRLKSTANGKVVTGKFFEHCEMTPVCLADEEERVKLLELCEQKVGVRLNDVLQQVK